MIDLVKQILTKANDADKVELTILHNAVVETSKEYKKNPVSSRLKDWQDAKKALAEAVELMGARYSIGVNDDDNNVPVVSVSTWKAGPWKFKSGALRYLQDGGWDIKKQTFYNHCDPSHPKGGRLAKNKNGEYTQAAVDRYAKSNLVNHKIAETQEEKEASSGVQREKLGAETRLKLAQAKKAEHELEVLEGKYFPKDQLELELAARAGVLEAGLKHLFQTAVPELITLCKGDQSRSADVINSLSAGLERTLNQYASTEEFHVMIKGIKN